MMKIYSFNNFAFALYLLFVMVFLITSGEWAAAMLVLFYALDLLAHLKMAMTKRGYDRYLLRVERNRRKKNRFVSMNPELSEYLPAFSLSIAVLVGGVLPQNSIFFLIVGAVIAFHTVFAS